MSAEDQSIYPWCWCELVLWMDKINESGATALFARVGRERCKAKSFIYPNRHFATDIEKIDIHELRLSGYPVICGAGWHLRWVYDFWT